MSSGKSSAPTAEAVTGDGAEAKDAPGGEGPLDLGAMQGLLAGLAGARGLVLAVSGGPDSMALMGMCALCADRLPKVHVATIDHGLRPSGRAEAEAVLAAATAFGFAARLLRWEGASAASAVQEKARRARYALLAEVAREAGASHIVTAHTLDDQAETMLMRLARGSGPEGLVGMRALVQRGAFLHARPLLGVAKARLVATCRARGWSFVDDPSNRDPRFARARWRTLMPALAAEGLDAAGLARFGRRLASVLDVVDRCAARAGAEARLEDEGGVIALDARRLSQEPAAVAERVLGRLLADFARPGPPRLARLEHLTVRILAAAGAGESFAGTLHGARLILARDGILRIRPEGERRRGRAGGAA